MKSLRNDIITSPEPSLRHFVCFEFFFFFFFFAVFHWERVAFFGLVGVSKVKPSTWDTNEVQFNGGFCFLGVMSWQRPYTFHSNRGYCRVSRGAPESSQLTPGGMEQGCPTVTVLVPPLEKSLRQDLVSMSLEYDIPEWIIILATSKAVTVLK